MFKVTLFQNSKYCQYNSTWILFSSTGRVFARYCRRIEFLQLSYMCIVGVKNVMNEERTFMTKNEERMMTKKEAANPALLPVSLLSLLMQQSRLSSKIIIANFSNVSCTTIFQSFNNAPQLQKTFCKMGSFYAGWQPQKRAYDCSTKLFGVSLLYIKHWFLIESTNLFLHYQTFTCFNVLISQTKRWYIINAK